MDKLVEKSYENAKGKVYDLMGNRTAVYKKDSKAKVVESEEYS